MLSVGLMSGTSLDGVDAALLLTDGVTTEPFGHPVHIPYSREIQNLLHEGLATARLHGKPVTSDPKIRHVEEILTEHHIIAVKDLLSDNGLKSKEIEVIGFHGQTLLHRPAEGWTWQIGDGQAMADTLQIPVVSDFRSNDVAAGGQGAPLVPIYHLAHIAGRPGNATLAIVNIGGVANITWIAASRAPEDLISCDSGPGNALLNDWIARNTGEDCDQDGGYARQGTVDEALLAQWMADDYFRQAPPKSLDRNSFTVPGLDKLSLEDGAATLTAFTAQAIADTLKLFPKHPESCFICGGGRHNPVMMEEVERRISPALISPVESIGWHGDFIEAEAFAFLAVRRLKNLPISFPGTTGVNRPMPGGVIHLPTNR
ncbi:anhydro-N-acetylmuramic acid kinase [Emcibacter nanhaiensis]|uniref:Anhydro-N-acetylmuramic acid kinase n=1 Tax=Emcibacter nanhaiensis TaxID=1505037 RepID=A0A501PTE4_9PROT|nr:anhydro-N-acetylmuramic acid kinase [Emcibacter nanhaiensis]